jgi:PLP dependent protein
MLPERIRHIDERIRAACARAGRLREEVTLVAVTKTQPISVINEAIALGLADIGENRVQEYLSKRPDLLPHRFHMIGHLQRNKVRMIAGLSALIHSVDAGELAREIDRRAGEAGIVAGVLLEVNTSGEASKEGVMPDGVEDLARAVRAMPNLVLRGLMTVADIAGDPEEVRPRFRLLRALRDAVREDGAAGCTELSMGMTGDFEVAVEEGATMIRIGSALFGPRTQQG